MSEKIQLDSIESAIEAIKNGEVIIVVDDENREMKETLFAPQKKSLLKLSTSWLLMVED